jgi:hypothetical protein
MSGLYKNRYKIPEDKFKEIMNLAPAEMAQAMDNYYINWVTNEELKKKDGEIASIKKRKQDLSKEVEKDGEIVELRAKLKTKLFEKTSEEKARLDEELKNATKEYNDDIKSFRNLFKTCADIKTKRVIKDDN